MTENEQPLNEPGQGAGEPSAPSDPPRPRRRKKPPGWKRLMANGLILVFTALVVVLVWSFVNRAFIEPPVKPETIRGGKTRTIQLDVLNGSGTPKLSQRFTDYLRARGFDVVEMGNYKDSRVEFTRVIDRAGNLAAAQQVAQALGVSKEHVVQEIDKHLYLDVSVVIGNDFRSLKPLQ